MNSKNNFPKYCVSPPQVCSLYIVYTTIAERSIIPIHDLVNPREGYSSSHFVCLSVTLCVTFFILEKAPFSGLKLTSVQSM